MAFSNRAAGTAGAGGGRLREEAPLIGTGVHCLTVESDATGAYFYRTEPDRPQEFSLGRSFGRTRLGIIHSPRGIYLIDTSTNALRGIAGFLNKKVNVVPFGAMWGCWVDEAGGKHPIRDPLEYLKGLQAPVSAEENNTRISFRFNVRSDDRDFLDARVRKRFREGGPYRHYVELRFQAPSGRFIEALAATVEAQTGADYQTNKIEGFPVRWAPVMQFYRELPATNSGAAIRMKAAAAGLAPADRRESAEERPAETGPKEKTAMSGGVAGASGGSSGVKRRGGISTGAPDAENPASPPRVPSAPGGASGEQENPSEAGRARLVPRAKLGGGGFGRRDSDNPKDVDRGEPQPQSAQPRRPVEEEISEKDAFVFRPQRPVHERPMTPKPMWGAEVELPKPTSYRLRPEGRLTDPLGRKLQSDFGRGESEQPRTAQIQEISGPRRAASPAEKTPPKPAPPPATERMSMVEMLETIRRESDPERQWKMVEPNLMMGRPERTYSLIANFPDLIRENMVSWAPARLKAAFSNQPGSILIGIMDKLHTNQVLAVAEENSESAKILQWLREREIDRMLHLEVTPEVENAEIARRALNVDRHADAQAVRKVWRTLLAFLNADHGRRDERAIHRRKDEIAKYLQVARDFLLRVGF